MKKLLFTIVAMLLPIMASADAVEINGICYILVSKAKKQAEVTTNPNKYSGDIVIPEHIEYEGVSYDVTSIGDNAFSSCIDMTSISIPNSVTHIGAKAFTACHGLSSLTIPNSVKSIDSEAFQYCTGLTSITLGSGVENIKSEAFASCI